MKMDLRWGFNNIRIHEGDESKAAFITLMGLYELMVMQFGLCNAPLTFQRMIDEVLAEEKAGGNVVVYIDDILIHNMTKEENWTLTRRVLKKLRDNRLYCQREKCVFEAAEVEFLGVMLGQGIVKISKKKTKTIMKEVPPMTRKRFEMLLGNHELSQEVHQELLNDCKAITWINQRCSLQLDGKCQEAFENLKEALVLAPVLAILEDEGKFRLETNASDVVTGAVLYQLKEDRNFHPVDYASKSYNKAEKNYTTYDKEMLGVMRGLEEWRNLLVGAAEPFKIMTNHRNLTYFQEPQKLTSRQVQVTMVILPAWEPGLW
jgi:hypothetical protein